ncbi:hypothetical protein [Coleofasciculus sp. F4-SAH-05]
MPSAQAKLIALYSQIKSPRDRIPSPQPNHHANSLVAVKGEICHAE